MQSLLIITVKYSLFVQTHQHTIQSVILKVSSASGHFGKQGHSKAELMAMMKDIL